jgi:hypothetical protein
MAPNHVLKTSLDLCREARRICAEGITLLDRATALLRAEHDRLEEAETLLAQEGAEAGSPRRSLASKVVGRIFWIARTSEPRCGGRAWTETLVIAHSEGRARAALRVAARSRHDLDALVDAQIGAAREEGGAILARTPTEIERVEDDAEVLGRFDTVTLDDGREVSLAEVIEARARP